LEEYPFIGSFKSIGKEADSFIDNDSFMEEAYPFIGNASFGEEEDPFIGNDYFGEEENLFVGSFRSLEKKNIPLSTIYFEPSNERKVYSLWFESDPFLMVLIPLCS